MRAINHALTGALIGLSIGQPVVALPVALASHFVCDVIPHYGANLSRADEMKSKFFQRLLLPDALLCLALVVVLAVRHPVHWEVAAICAFLAASPDLASIGQFRRVNNHKTLQPGAYVRFANGIQWFERPIGAVVEAAWLIGAIILLLPFLR
ncbi:MAG TPA: hypothetical protein VIJ68_03525 [Candidatus Saccharimonadales bacterium]